jgi:hypothetical protein
MLMTQQHMEWNDVQTNFAITVFFHHAIGVSPLERFAEEVVDIMSPILACGTRLVSDGLYANIYENSILIHIFVVLDSSLLMPAGSFG